VNHRTPAEGRIDGAGMPSFPGSPHAGDRAAMADVCAAVVGRGADEAGKDDRRRRMAG
jgi:hypothetical protein